MLGSVFAEALTLEQIREAFAAIRDGQSQKHQKSDEPRGFIRARAIVLPPEKHKASKAAGSAAAFTLPLFFV